MSWPRQPCEIESLARKVAGKTNVGKAGLCFVKRGVAAYATHFLWNYPHRANKLKSGAVIRVGLRILPKSNEDDLMHRLAAFAVLLFGLSAWPVVAADLPQAVYRAPAPDLTRWTIAASFDLIALEKRKGAAIPLATGLSSTELNLGHSNSADVKVEVGFANVGVEARHIGQFGWFDQQSTTATTLFTNPNINFGSRLVPIQYASDLTSWEVGAFWKFFRGWKVFAAIGSFESVKV